MNVEPQYIDTGAPKQTEKQFEATQWAVLLYRKLGDRIYSGSVPPKVIARRRAANKVARKQRKLNRKGN